MRTGKILFLIIILLLAFNFCLLAQGPPPPPSQSGDPAGVPLDGASGMLVLVVLGALYKKYFPQKSLLRIQPPKPFS